MLKRELAIVFYFKNDYKEPRKIINAGIGIRVISTFITVFMLTNLHLHAGRWSIIRIPQEEYEVQKQLNAGGF